MSLNNVSELSVTPASNVDFLGTSILGNGLLSTADDSFRNLASFIAKWWDDIGAVNTIGGTANAITITTPTLYAAFKQGMVIAFKNSNGPNTGATTVNVDGLGVKAIRLQGDSACAGGELVANGVYLLRYDTVYNSAAGAWVLLYSSAPVGSTTFLDSVFRLQDNGDVTKQIAFELSGLTTGTTRTLTPPDASITIAGLNLEGQTVSGGARTTVKDLGTLSSAGSNTITPDPGARPHQKITNDHAGSILPGSNTGDYLLDVINASGAGVITLTGWTQKGDAFDTTTTSKFLCSCHVTGDQKVLIVTKVA